MNIKCKVRKDREYKVINLPSHLAILNTYVSVKNEDGHWDRDWMIIAINLR